MANKKLPFSFPTFYVRPTELPIAVYHVLNHLITSLRTLHVDIVKAFNFNSIEFISQNNQPTPEEGRIILWHDADATAGNPTHYLVVKMNGTVRTFRSVENA